MHAAFYFFAAYFACLAGERSAAGGQYKWALKREKGIYDK